MRNRGLGILMLALGAGFLYGLWTLYQLRFEAGDIYPAYSSLRADPLGTKALHDSIGLVHGKSAARNYLPLTRLAKGKSTVLLLGLDPLLFEGAAANKLQELEALAASGARVVGAMRPVRRVDPPKDDPDSAGKEPRKRTAIEQRWGISFAYEIRGPKDGEEDRGVTKQTALSFRSDGHTLLEVERHFGTGAIVLVANSYPFSNEALAGERNTEWLARAIGGSPLVVFDENHLGVRDTSGVATLARKYHLQGLVAGLAVLLALFIWKNATSFLPARPDPQDTGESLEAKDTGSGLANLMRRNIPVKNVMKVCVEQWERSQYGGRFHPRAKVARVKGLAHRDDPTDAYREAAAILTERSRG